MTITIHLGSLLGGFVLGSLFGSLLFTFISLDDRWHVGFSEGVKAGRKLEKEDKERRNDAKSGSKSGCREAAINACPDKDH